MTRKEEIHKEAMSMSFDYPYLCNEEDNNSEYVKKLEDIANWADETILDKASEWLKKNLQNYIENDRTSEKDFIEQFRKSMEE
jgi:hypothetical protein